MNPLRLRDRPIAVCIYLWIAALASAPIALPFALAMRACMGQDPRGDAALWSAGFEELALKLSTQPPHTAYAWSAALGVFAAVAATSLARVALLDQVFAGCRQLLPTRGAARRMLHAIWLQGLCALLQVVVAAVLMRLAGRLFANGSVERDLARMLAMLVALAAAWLLAALRDWVMLETFAYARPLLAALRAAAPFGPRLLAAHAMRHIGSAALIGAGAWLVTYLPALGSAQLGAGYICIRVLLAGARLVELSFFTRAAKLLGIALPSAPIAPFSDPAVAAK